MICRESRREVPNPKACELRSRNKGLDKCFGCKGAVPGVVRNDEKSKPPPPPAVNQSQVPIFREHDHFYVICIPKNAGKEGVLKALFDFMKVK